MQLLHAVVKHVVPCVITRLFDKMFYFGPLPLFQHRSSNTQILEDFLQLEENAQLKLNKIF